jgi:hypothetical protein
MSRGRADRLTTHRLVEGATLVVPESEVAAYEHATRRTLRVVPIPDALRGVSKVRNWIIHRFEEECVVMYDDDCSAVRAILSPRKLMPSEVEAMVENTAYCAAGAGAKMFGWMQRPDPRLVCRNDPFALASWVGGAVGVIGKEVRWDELLSFKCDIDACLTELMKNRIVWKESRFCFIQERDKNLGGNSLFRTPERIEAEKRYLASKWKAHITIDKYKSHDRVKMNVTRWQRVDL